MFLEITPDTSGYMIAGFVIAFATMGLYVFSLVLRNKNLARDIEVLEKIPSQSSPAKTKPNKSARSKGTSRKKARKK